MTKKITLQSNNGFGWSFGNTGSRQVDLVTEHNFGWRVQVPTAPVNSVVPAISGTARVGQTLTASTGTWSGSPAFTYQWKRGSTNISGATASTYVLVTADAGAVITVTVTGTNSIGSASATSSGTAAVTMTPANTVVPAITGTATVGQTLSSTTGTWTGSPTPTYARQWKRGGVDIAGATAATYTLVAADYNAVITVTVTGTNSAGNASATSAGTAAVAGVAPASTGLPTIAGTAQVGATLTATNGTWSGTPTPTYARQWKADGADISGATGTTYVPVEGDVGKAITVTVTATNAAGNANATSAATAGVIAA